MALCAALTLIFATFALTSGWLPWGNAALADSTRVVSLFYDGQKKLIRTDATIVGEAVKRAGVSLSQGDLVEPAADTFIPQGYFNINIYRARPVLVVDGPKLYRVRSAYQSPRLVATQAGLTVYREDRFTTQKVTNFVGEGTIGEKVVITRATPVTVAVDGQTVLYRTQASTVGELLREQRISLGASDSVTPGQGSRLSAGQVVRIVRVAEAVVAVDETIQRATKNVNDPTLIKGQTTVQAAGADGHRRVTYRIHYRDGVETGRETLKVEHQVNPVDRVVLVGTKVLFGGSIEYWRPTVASAAAANGVDPNLMLAIMRCESNGNASASNGSHFGLYQYDWPTWLGAGGTRDNIFDGPAQIRITAWKIANYGTRAWAASRSCWL